MKYIIKMYTKNCKLYERFDGYNTIDEALTDIEWFKKCDKMEGNEDSYYYEIDEEE